MGLDMYLEKEIFVGAQYNHRNVEGNIDISVGGEPLSIDFDRVSNITEQVGYWRKANQIHNWFVDNVQGGVDECQRTPVSKDQLLELRRVCLDVLEDKSKAGELLPTASGFFFGTTEYDDFYFGDIAATIEIIDRALSSYDESTPAYERQFYYQSSW